MSLVNHDLINVSPQKDIHHPRSLKKEKSDTETKKKISYLENDVQTIPLFSDFFF